MNIVYFVVGSKRNVYLQAWFSIMTFLQQKNFLTRITVITDHPERFRCFADTIVHCITVDDAELRAWYGAHEFFWRAKVKAVERAALEYPDEALVYVDTDTFLFGDLSGIARQLVRGHSFMNNNEGRLSQAKNKTEVHMWQAMGNKIFAGITITPEMCMWNAGVIAMPGGSAVELSQLTLSLCDSFLNSLRLFKLAEQFAFSVALYSNTTMHIGEEYIGHYWANKEGWTQVIHDISSTAVLESLSFDEILAQVRAVDLSAIPLRRAIPNSRGKIIKIIERLTPEREATYIATKKLEK